MKILPPVAGSFLVIVLQVLQGVLSDRTLLSCSFETSCGLGHTPESQFYWSRIGGATPNRNTGPINDHTLQNRQGKYIYAPSSKRGFDFGTRSTLYSAEYHLSYGRGRLEFYYHMWDGSGANDMGTLAVYVCGSTEPLWSRTRNQGNRWRWTGLLEFSCQKTFRVYLVASRGKYQSDIAVDDLLITDISAEATTRITTAVLPTTPPSPTTEPVRTTSVKSTIFHPTTAASTTVVKIQPTTASSVSTVKTTRRAPPTAKISTAQPSTMSTTRKRSTAISTTKITAPPTVVKATKSVMTTKVMATSRSVAPRGAKSPFPRVTVSKATERMSTSKSAELGEAKGSSPRLTFSMTTVVQETKASSLLTGEQPVSTVFNRSQPLTVGSGADPRLQGGSSLAAIGPIVVICVTIFLIALTACLTVQRKKRNHKSTAEEQLVEEATDKFSTSRNTKTVGLTNYSLRELLELADTSDEDVEPETNGAYGNQEIGGGTSKKRRGESVLYAAIPDQSSAHNEYL